GGIQLGYNYQIRTFVIGVEWDGDWTSISHRGGQDLPGIGTLDTASNTRWVTTIAARLGIVGESWMGFFKIGEGWVNSRFKITDLTLGNSVSVTGTDSGVLVGGGFEWGFTGNWIGRVEYDFIDLGNASLQGFAGSERFGLDHSLQMLKFGIDYRFCPC